MNKVIIVGGGAAGMLAGIIAARNGCPVVLYEKNEKRPGQCSSSRICLFCDHGIRSLFHAIAYFGSVYRTFTGDGDVYPDGDAASQFL